MNRREFLAAIGVGALSLAGKGITRPSFTLEIEVDSSAIWVNGKRPDKAWSHDNNLSGLDAGFTDLVVGKVKIESIKAETSNCDCSPEVGTEVIMVNSIGAFKGKVTKIVEGGVVLLKNNENLKIADGQRYFRMEF